MSSLGPHTQPCGCASPSRHPAFTEAGRRLDALAVRIEACAAAAGLCPVAAPVREEIAPAVRAGEAEPLWRATLEHAQTALTCRRDCPAVDLLRAVLDATRPAYRAAG